MNSWPSGKYVHLLYMYSILGRGFFCFNYCLNSAWHGGDQFVALLRWCGSPGFFDSGLQLICIFLVSCFSFLMSWITEINELFHNILIYWCVCARVFARAVYIYIYCIYIYIYIYNIIWSIYDKIMIFFYSFYFCWKFLQKKDLYIYIKKIITYWIKLCICMYKILIYTPVIKRLVTWCNFPTHP